MVSKFFFFFVRLLLCVCAQTFFTIPLDWAEIWLYQVPVRCPQGDIEVPRAVWRRAGGRQRAAISWSWRCRCSSWPTSRSREGETSAGKFLTQNDFDDFFVFAEPLKILCELRYFFFFWVCCTIHLSGCFLLNSVLFVSFFFFSDSWLAVEKAGCQRCSTGTGGV